MRSAQPFGLIDYLLIGRHIVSNVHSVMLFFSTVTAAHRSDAIELIATVGSVVLLILTFPLSVFYCFKVS